MSTESAAVEALVPDQFQHIDSAKVTIGGLQGHRLELTWKGNLLQLDWEKNFIEPFRHKNNEIGFYVGLGKTLDGLIRFAYHTGDAELLALKNHVVGEILAAQDPDGYLGLYPPEGRISRCWDVHEMAYLLFALVTDWRYFGADESLQRAVKIGDHIIARLSRQIMESSEPGISKPLVFLGLDRALLALYHATSDKRYLDFCIEELDLLNWNLPIVEWRHGPVDGHAYAFLTRALAQVELYQMLGDEKLLGQSQRALDYLLKEHGLVISGTSSIDECWHSDQTGSGDLGETCATAYLIRLSDKLLRLDGDAAHGDLMERSIYNALFGAQSPDGRQLRYYVPFEGDRAYWPLDTYCCPGNFRRIMGELPEMIYYLGQGGLAVNLYTESTLETELAGGIALNLHQETRYPAEGTVKFHLGLSRPSTFTLRLRRPVWCESYTLTLNGASFEAGVERGFLTITREWQPGDTLIFDMEMPVRLVRGIEKQEGRAAVMAGPMVYTLNPELNAGLAGVDLKELVIESVERDLIADDHLHSGGSACCVRVAGLPDSLLLTEFADPDGKASYFVLGRGSKVTDDPLQKTN